MRYLVSAGAFVSVFASAFGAVFVVVFFVVVFLVVVFVGVLVSVLASVLGSVAAEPVAFGSVPAAPGVAAEPLPEAEPIAPELLANFRERTGPLLAQLHPTNKTNLLARQH